MSAATDTVEPDIAESLSQSVATIKHAAADMHEIARREGIDRDSVLGPLVSVLGMSIAEIGTIVERFDSRVAAHIQEARQQAESECRKLKLMVEAADAAVRQATLVQRNLEFEREKVAARLVEHLGPQIAEGIKHWRVIKETQHNRRKAWQLVGIVTACGVLLTGGGYYSGLAAGTTKTGLMAALWRECSLHPVPDKTGQHTYCLTDNLVPR